MIEPGASAVPVRAPAARPRGPSGSPAIWGAAALAAHALLGLAMVRVPVLGAVQAFGAFAFGLIWALSGRRPGRVVAAAAYIAGAEVLWRMTGAPIYWEFSKYAISVLFLVGALRRGRGRFPALPILYFLFLLPSVALTLADPLPVAINNLSFNLSGPLSLMASVLFLSRLRVPLPHFRRLLLVAAAPLCGVSAVTLRGLRDSRMIEFGTQSNFASSGGFAPNQVSAALGFGFTLVALYLLTGPTRWMPRAALLALLMTFGAQSAVTFSRGGLYMAGGSLIAAFVPLWREARSRRRVLVGVSLVIFLTVGFIIPRLVSLTGGAILARFRETSTTGRSEIVHADLETWKEHPVTGVGPGKAAEGRARFFRTVASHTEFTRLLAEHGLFGVLAMGCLIALIRSAVARPAGTTARALRAAMLTWSSLFMLVDGMRLAAPALAFGLAFVEVLTSRPRPKRRRPAFVGPARTRPAAVPSFVVVGPDGEAVRWRIP